MKPVVVVDLFCGMGGFTQGAIDAGAEVILSVDFWDEACRVHESNHPNTRVERLELGDPLYYKTLLRFLEPYRKHNHIHIHGSPPCQALSNASSRNPEEGMPMVIWYLNLIKSCQPDSWSMENVVPVRKRLPDGTPNVILNSADFGVPQTRKRCYAGAGWVAEPTHAKEGSPFLPGQEKILWKWVSVIEALPQLMELVPVPSMTEQYKTASKDKPYPTVTSQSPKQLRVAMLNTSGAGASTGKRLATSDKEIEKPCLTINNNQPSIRTVRLEALGANAKRHQDRTIGEPSKTICLSGNQAGARVFDHEADPPQRIRSLTMSETLVLQGFSSDYDMSAADTQKSRWTMVGNAVPPPVAEAVIRGIIQ